MLSGAEVHFLLNDTRRITNKTNKAKNNKKESPKAYE